MSAAAGAVFVLRADICSRLQQGCLHSEFWTFPIAGDQEPGARSMVLLPDFEYRFPDFA